MTAKQDGSGNIYFDVGNIRVTAVPKTWDNCPGIRVQAYKESGGLHQGAELPIPDKQIAFDFLSAIHKALEHCGI